MVKTVSPPDWVVAEPVWQPERNAVWESCFTVGNGYLGIRGAAEESFDAGPTWPESYVAGVYNPGADGVPELAPTAGFMAVEILLGGQALLMAPGRVGRYQRHLDMRRGLLLRQFAYAGDTGATHVAFERFAEMANPHVAGQSVVLKPLDWAGPVTVRLWLDARTRAGRHPHLRLLHGRHMGRDRLLLVTETTETRIRIGHACRVEAWVRQAAPPKPRHVGDGKRLGFEFEVELECNQEARFDRLVATYTSRDPETTSVERCCLEDVRALRGAGYGVHRRRHVRAWKRRWDRADVLIDGPEDDQRAVRFAIFHLVQACPQRNPDVSIAAKGLTGPGYRGHVFWDTEVFMVPLFVATDPPSARHLLEYRVRTLDGARRKARANGYAGAMFAWESTDTGDETCPPYVPDPNTGEPVRVLTGELQHHITADVLYAARQYVAATGDTVFRERELLVLAVEVARFWASRVTHDREAGRYEVRGVIGPDEYHEAVANNAYTNALAVWSLMTAADEVERMREVHARSRLLAGLEVSEAETDRWRNMAAGMARPAIDAEGVLEQHEGFFRLRDVDPGPLSVQASTEPVEERMLKIQASQVLKQADVLMLPVLMPGWFTREALRANYAYYEPRTTHDSSLSPCIHAIVAADLNRQRDATSYFRRSAMIDLEDTMGNTDTGLHLAAMGGTWQAVVRGFLGLRPGMHPAEARPRLPSSWRRVTLRIQHLGRRFHVEATPDGVRATPER